MSAHLSIAQEKALSLVDKWDAPLIVRQYLKTGDENLRAAAEEATAWVLRTGLWSRPRETIAEHIRAAMAAWEATQPHGFI